MSVLEAGVLQKAAVAGAEMEGEWDEGDQGQALTLSVPGRSWTI